MTKFYPYLIIGGGIAADAAVMGIRAVDSDGEIGILTDEEFPPYRRPMLSKSIWQAGVSADTIWLDTQTEGVQVFTSQRVVFLDLESNKVTTRTQEEFQYDKLLIATGCSPARELTWTEKVLYFRGYDDYLLLRDWTEYRRHFAVIGGGYIGSEIAAALAMMGKEVSMFFSQEGICARILPPELSLALNRYYQQKGIELFPKCLVENVTPAEEGYAIRSMDGREWSADEVIAGLGVRPNDRLARDAGLQVGNGIWADECLQTSHDKVYAAGDVANWLHPLLMQRIRVEHEDNAIATGYYAGLNMAGQRTECEHIPSFYSQLFDIRYDAVGELDPKNPTRLDWDEPFIRGAICYLRDDSVQGVLLWNQPDLIDEAKDRLMKPL